MGYGAPCLRLLVIRLEKVRPEQRNWRGSLLGCAPRDGSPGTVTGERHTALTKGLGEGRQRPGLGGRGGSASPRGASEPGRTSAGRTWLRRAARPGAPGLRGRDLGSLPVTEKAHRHHPPTLAPAAPTSTRPQLL